jgi:hypothetical protein
MVDVDWEEKAVDEQGAIYRCHSITLMPLMFNSILHKAGLPLGDVILVRHQDKEAIKGRRPFDLWRNNRPEFDRYQSRQKTRDRKIFSKPYWAVFVVNDDNETMFAGIYVAEYKGILWEEEHSPAKDKTWKAGSLDDYDLRLSDTLCDYVGKCFIDWGPAPIAWKQYAEGNDKRVTRCDVIVDQRGELTKDPFAVEQPKIESTTKEALINARNGQGSFRQHVLQLWDNRCALTRSATLKAIRASHIKPWRDSSDEERLDPYNGLPLVATLDALFDAGLIAFNRSGTLLVSSRLNSEERKFLGISSGKLVKKPSACTAEYLEYHRNRFFPE